MNIAILGYGRMGHEVEAIALERGHAISSTIDPKHGSFESMSVEALEGADGIIEFGLPEGILERVQIACEHKLPMVIGTTGWNAELPRVEKIVHENGGKLLYGSNFSIGVNMFFRIVEQAAELLNAADNYDIMLAEYHHKLKKDSPSGTALTIANKILQANKRKTDIVIEPLQRAIDDNELHVSSVRGGTIPGTHTVTIDSAADSISLTHTARNRSGFALGSVQSLEWLSNQAAGIYSVDDFFESFLSNGL